MYASSTARVPLLWNLHDLVLVAIVMVICHLWPTIFSFCQRQSDRHLRGTFLIFQCYPLSFDFRRGIGPLQTVLCRQIGLKDLQNLFRTGRQGSGIWLRPCSYQLVIISKWQCQLTYLHLMANSLCKRCSYLNRLCNLLERRKSIAAVTIFWFAVTSAEMTLSWHQIFACSNEHWPWWVSSHRDLSRLKAPKHLLSRPEVFFYATLTQLWLCQSSQQYLIGLYH